MPEGRSTTKAARAAVDDPARRRLPPLLRRTWYALNQAFRRRLAPLGITPDQFTVLRWLSEHEPDGLTQRDLADLMASDPNTVTSVLTRMERSGLVDRWPDPDDRRANRVHLSKKGGRVYAEARRIAVDLQTELLEALPASRRQRFLADLHRVADAAAEALERS